MRKFNRPNILLLYTDQQRLDSLKCYGNSIAVTPNIDSLADDGVTFEKYFTQSPICTPSRVCLLSGRYCSSHGVGTNGLTVSEDLLTINKVLSSYGYHTANLGKLHFLPHSFRDHRDVHPSYGFDKIIISDEPGCYDDAYSKWVEMIDPSQVDKIRTGLPSKAKQYGKPVYSTQPRDPHTPYLFEGDDDLTHTAFVASETIKYLNERKTKEEPFFCISGFYAPHAPVNPPKKFVDLYKLEDMKLPIKGENENWTRNLGELSDDEWKKIRQYYLALVSHVDYWVGEIIKTLKTNSQYDNTIIIFTSDHGEYLGDHGRVQKGMPGEDVITNVPFIITYPKKLERGLRIKELCESVDLFPTLCDLTGIQVPPVIQGETLIPIINKIKKGKDVILTEQFEPNGKKETTIRDERYRYYINSLGEEKFFDIENDKNEINNVVNKEEYKMALSDMRRKMILKVQKAAYPNLEKIFDY